MSDVLSKIQGESSDERLSSGKPKPKGKVTLAVASTAEGAITSAANDGAATARQANDAYVTSFAHVRAHGAEEALKLVTSAGDASREAIAGIDVDAVVSEAVAGSPFSKGASLLLG